MTYEEEVIDLKIRKALKTLVFLRAVIKRVIKKIIKYIIKLSIKELRVLTEVRPLRSKVSP